MEYPSKLIEQAVSQISRLPGIGKKTALRLVLHLLRQPEQETLLLSESLSEMRGKIQYCSRCHNISDQPVCAICSSPRRNQSLICVVEDIRDVMAIENTGQYQGVYHVLGGIISPMDGIGPEELQIESLVQRLQSQQESGAEVMMALPATMEGDTTAFYLAKKLKPLQVNLTTIARGIPVGGELEYADEITLGRSIATRTRYLEN